MSAQLKLIQSAQTLPNLSILPRSWALQWSYASHDKRDLRVDFLRGFAVFMMVVDHFGGSSWLYLITGGNAFFTSGAEAFVFISGLVVGLVYGSIALKEGLASARTKAFSRAFTLYKLNVVLTLGFAAFSLCFGLPWAHDLQVGNPFSFVLDVLLLRRTMYLVDIPLMNALLLLLAPLGLWLLVSKRSAWLVTASGIVWLAFQVFPVQAQLPWPIIGNTTFNLAAWQLLFFVGMTIGFHREKVSRKLNRIPRLPYLLLTGALLLLLLDLHSANGALSEFLPGINAQSLLADLFRKSALAPGRLVATFIVFQFAYLAATMLWKPIYGALGWLLLPLGQNSLYCYSMHVVLIGLFYSALPRLPFDILAMGTLNTTLQLLVVIGLWMMTKCQFLFKVVPR